MRTLAGVEIDSSTDSWREFPVAENRPLLKGKTIDALIAIYAAGGGVLTYEN